MATEAVTAHAVQNNMRPSDLSFQANCWIWGLRYFIYSIQRLQFPSSSAVRSSRFHFAYTYLLTRMTSIRTVQWNWQRRFNRLNTRRPHLLFNSSSQNYGNLQLRFSLFPIIIWNEFLQFCKNYIFSNHVCYQSYILN